MINIEWGVKCALCSSYNSLCRLRITQTRVHTDIQRRGFIQKLGRLQCVRGWGYKNNSIHTILILK